MKDGKWVGLKPHNTYKIKRHVKVRDDKLVYDGDTPYWSRRLGELPGISTRVSKLLKTQKGRCGLCKLDFRPGDVMEVDHIVPRSRGGKDDYTNLQLLHGHCHDQK
jgi:RNA-directed DNA polymerase